MPLFIYDGEGSYLPVAGEPGDGRRLHVLSSTTELPRRGVAGDLYVVTEPGEVAAASARVHRPKHAARPGPVVASRAPAPNPMPYALTAVALGALGMFGGGC